MGVYNLNFTLSELGFQNGKGSPYNWGTTTMRAGGAILLGEGNTLRIANCKLEANTSELGGAIFNAGDLTVEDTLFFNNQSLTSGGGAIYNFGTLNLIRVRFENNTANTFGGGIYNHARKMMTINDSTFIDNTALTKGGGLTSKGPSTINNTNFENNTAEAGGGAELSDTGTTLTNTNFIKNSASNNGGAMVNTGTTIMTNVNFLDNQAGKEGGGIFNVSELTIKNATFSLNQASQGAGMSLSNGMVVLTNVTISGNIATQDGGAISVLQAKPTLINNTLTNNKAALRGGAINNVMSEIQLINTIISGNDSTSNQGNNCYTLQNHAITTSLGHNLEDENTCMLDEPTDLINQNPLLAPLANNGGYGMTHALRVNSPAIDAGDMDTCPPQDQRGVGRMDGDGDSIVICDIGAFEYRRLVIPHPIPIP